MTWLPESGSTIGRGQVIYRVDDQKVPVFYGQTPLFRKLDKAGMTGSDVTVVEDNLRALGYDIDGRPGAAGWGDTAGQGKTTDALLAAIKRWQKNAGMPVTGTLDAGDVVVVPGEVRVGAVAAQLGGDAQEELMTLTSTTKAVTVPVAATETGAMRKDAKVSVVLPNGKEAPGTVTKISRIAAAGKPTDSSDPAKVDVTVELNSDAAVKDLDGAPVRVVFTAETRHGVLTVPVGALVALSEGGYAVQKLDGTLIAVKTGMFSRGLVEITGKVTAGTKVVVAS
ncbi:peptidoglycan-binding protein [Streptomyces sp. NPDC055709]